MAKRDWNMQEVYGLVDVNPRPGFKVTGSPEDLEKLSDEIRKQGIPTTAEWTIKCMLCPATVTIQAPDGMDWHQIVWFVARESNWAMARSSNGTFICCSSCYPKAFDLSQGGSVGKLRPEFEHLARSWR